MSKRPRDRAKVIGEGEICPKCLKPMLRKRHKATWRPKPGQPFYFKAWDHCAPCKHVQHYEFAKVFLRKEVETE